MAPEGRRRYQHLFELCARWGIISKAAKVAVKGTAKAVRAVKASKVVVKAIKVVKTSAKKAASVVNTKPKTVPAPSIKSAPKLQPVAQAKVSINTTQGKPKVADSGQPERGLVATRVEKNSAGNSKDGEGLFAAKGTGNVSFINPNNIRFSQSSVNGAKEITDSMKGNGWKGSPIDVVKMPDGNLTTIDNTRVLAAKYAGIDVKANVYNANDPISADIAQRFISRNGQIPQTWGEAVTNRINNQNSAYRKTYPNGSNITGWDGR